MTRADLARLTALAVAIAAHDDDTTTEQETDQP